MGAISPMHLVLVLAIAVLVLGPGKLPETGAAIGRAIRSFREEADGRLERASTAEGQGVPPGTGPTAA